MVIFTEEILNGKIHLLCSVTNVHIYIYLHILYIYIYIYVYIFTYVHIYIYTYCTPLSCILHLIVTEAAPDVIHWFRGNLLIKLFLNIFAILTSAFNKLSGLQPCSVIKKRQQHKKWNQRKEVFCKKNILKY